MLSICIYSLWGKLIIRTEKYYTDAQINFGWSTTAENIQTWLHTVSSNSINTCACVCVHGVLWVFCSCASHEQLTGDKTKKETVTRWRWLTRPAAPPSHSHTCPCKHVHTQNTWQLKLSHWCTISAHACTQWSSSPCACRHTHLLLTVLYHRATARLWSV